MPGSLAPQRNHRIHRRGPACVRQFNREHERSHNAVAVSVKARGGVMGESPVLRSRRCPYFRRAADVRVSARRRGSRPPGTALRSAALVRPADRSPVVRGGSVTLPPRRRLGGSMRPAPTASITSARPRVLDKCPAPVVSGTVSATGLEPARVMGATKPCTWTAPELETSRAQQPKATGYADRN